MNKYLPQSRLAQQRRVKQRGCDRKLAFPSREAAARRGQDVYRCKFCRNWHRTGALATLANSLARRRRNRNGGTP